MTRSLDLIETAAVFAELGQEFLAMEQAADVLNSLTSRSVDRIPGCVYASVTTMVKDGFTTVASTDPRAVRADVIQYELGSGPCVDAIVDDATYRTANIAEDRRWPIFGQRAATEVGVASMLAFRLITDTDDLVAALNLYSDQRNAFDDADLAVGMLLATHGGLAVSAVLKRQTITDLRKALETSREIGIAIGIIMDQRKVPRAEAFDLLRIVSQYRHVKLRDVALEVATTGELGLPPPR